MAEPIVDLIGFLIVFGFFILAIWLLFSHIGDMARRREHNPWAWWFLAIFWSPFGSILILWFFFPIKNDLV